MPRPATLTRLVTAAAVALVSVVAFAGPAVAQADEVSNERPLRYVWLGVGIGVLVVILIMIQVFEVNRRKGPQPGSGAGDRR